MNSDPDPLSSSDLPVLSREEIRVLGALMEKEHLTPENYPMTVNSLLIACNQKTSRDPITDYDEETLSRALEALQARKLVSWIHQAGARTRKFRHHADRQFYLDEAESAVLCVLLLRGPQTVGELRTRTERIHFFPGLSEVEAVLHQLEAKPNPLVLALPKTPGRKETRYAHLLGGIPDPEPYTATASELPSSDTPSLPAVWQEEIDRRQAEMRREIAALRQEISDLREAFAAFKQQFD